MFARLGLGWKIGIGFGIVIGLCTAAGIIACVEMNDARHQSKLLGSQDVPLLTVASDLQHDCLDTMFAMRGFSMSGDSRYLDEARPAIANVHEAVDQGRSLLADKPGLEAHRKLLDDAATAFSAYEKLANETEAVLAAVAEDRQELDRSMTACQVVLQGYLEELHGKLKQEAAEVATVTSDKAQALTEVLLHRQTKLETSSELMQRLDAVLAAAWRCLAERDPKSLALALPLLGEVDQRLEALKRITTKSVDIDTLNKAKASADEFAAASKGLLRHLEQRSRLDSERLATANKVMELAARIAEGSAELANSAATAAGQQLTSATTTSMVGLTIALLLGVGFALALTRSILTPIRRGVAFAKDVATGDLTKRLEITARDEIGELAMALNTMVDNLANLLKRIANGAGTLAGASTELSATATQLASGAEETTAQSATVAGAAEEMSATLTLMAGSAGQVAGSVRTVAAAVEEMTASIAGVTNSAGNAATVAGDAARLAAASNDKIHQLGDAANAIGRVIDVIQDIADQTNLLALNATIEAARAGEAGKGFAVVASEVKALARQTAEATDDIRQRIEAIQGSTHDAVGAIGEISKVIGKVDEVSRSIAGAMEEQSLATKEIAQNVAQTTTAATSMNEGVSQSAEAGRDITRNIAGVDQAARQTAEGAGQVQTAGLDLSRLAEDLQSAVATFKL